VGRTVEVRSIEAAADRREAMVSGECAQVVCTTRRTSKEALSMRVLQWRGQWSVASSGADSLGSRIASTKSSLHRELRRLED
jgi:uncharacterized protein YhbP (UPF0306 family)